MLNQNKIDTISPSQSYGYATVGNIVDLAKIRRARCEFASKPSHVDLAKEEQILNMIKSVLNAKL